MSLSIHLQMIGQGLALFTRIGLVLVNQRGALFPFVPILLAVGIGGFFLLPVEPAVWVLVLAGAIGGIWAGISLRLSPFVAPLNWAMALIFIGFALAGMRAHFLSGPVLSYRYYGPIEGRIVALDRSGSDALRLTLDRVVLARHAPDRTPKRVRISLHGDQHWITPFPGDIVILTGHLTPPSGPAEPGGFDFRRHAWFQQIGGVGYSRTPVLRMVPGRGQASIGAFRMELSQRVKSHLSGAVGAVAAALITGDRSGLQAQTLRDLRRSNLAHLLAISGLHIGLVSGFVFAALRLGFAAVPVVGLRVPAKKLAAVGALLVAAGYLLLSGRNVATERAFIMVAVFLIALLFDRRALSLRAVAVGAIIVLTLRPESLLSPGFQMSFAATTALVAVFEALRAVRWWHISYLRFPVTLLLSSLVAGLATAPFGAAHFNQLSQLGLPANLLSVPLMGAVVMPAAVVATILMPLGAEAGALWAMGLGLRWILAVAQWIAAQPLATRLVVSPPWTVLPILSLGVLFLILWRGKLRFVGLIPIFLAFGLWGTTQRPDLLIAENGALAGLATPRGRALSKAKGAGFVAAIWLENDGDPSAQDQSAERWPQQAQIGPHRVITVSGKRAAQSARCQKGDWLLSTHPMAEELPCRVFDPKTLAGLGSLAIFVENDKLRIVSATELAGRRLWSPQAQ